MELSLPSSREAVNAKECSAAIKDKWWRRTRMFWSLEVQECKMLTKYIAQTALHTLWGLRDPTRKQQLLGKVPCGQLFIVAVELQTIPQGTIHNRGPKPSEPAALDEAWKSEWGGQNLRPSHERKNSHNQDRSRPRSRLGSTFGV